MPTIGVDDTVMEKLKELAIEQGLIFRTPNEVLRRALGIDGMERDTMQAAVPSEGLDTTGIPSSRNPVLQNLLSLLLPQLQNITGRPSHFELKPTGRWVHLPDNFVTVKPQERIQDLALTVYGDPHDFRDLKPSFEMKRDQNSYSRFKISRADQVPEAVRVINRAWELSRNKGRR